MKSYYDFIIFKYPNLKKILYINFDEIDYEEVFINIKK